MSATETVESLIKLGVLISDAVQKTGGKPGDWETFLKSPEFSDIADSVSNLLGSIKKNDVKGTIKALNEKQQALLAGKTLADLPTDKLLQYGELGNVKVVLAGAQVVETMNSGFLNWLVDDALPVLVKAAPTVIPLLV